MQPERLGKGDPLSHLELLFHSYSHPFYHDITIVFVTGNARKLEEVREILAQGTPIEMESRDLDRECVKLLFSC